jgi:hypothetical protein
LRHRAFPPVAKSEPLKVTDGEAQNRPIKGVHKPIAPIKPAPAGPVPAQGLIWKSCYERADNLKSSGQNEPSRFVLAEVLFAITPAMNPMMMDQIIPTELSV